MITIQKNCLFNTIYISLISHLHGYWVKGHIPGLTNTFIEGIFNLLELGGIFFQEFSIFLKLQFSNNFWLSCKEKYSIYRFEYYKAWQGPCELGHCSDSNCHNYFQMCIYIQFFNRFLQQNILPTRCTHTPTTPVSIVTFL